MTRDPVPTTIRPATGRLGVLTPGLGSVATTFMAGVESIRRGHSVPIGSLTQMAMVGDQPLRELVSLAALAVSKSLLVSRRRSRRPLRELRSCVPTLPPLR